MAAHPQGEAPGAPDELVTSHLYLVQHVLNSLAMRYPRHVDRSELWSAGALGLVDAAHRFDESAGVPFVRYAAIRGWARCGPPSGSCHPCSAR